MKRVSLILGVTLLGAVNCIAQKELTKEEAVSLAESAIVKNGCTDLSPLKLRPKLSFESHRGEFVIKHRLNCRAIAVVPLKEISGFAWMVIFHLEHWCPECPTKDRPRAVLLNQDGSKMRLVRRMSKIPKAWKSG